MSNSAGTKRTLARTPRERVHIASPSRVELTPRGFGRRFENRARDASMLVNPAARKRLLAQIITPTPHETPGESSTMLLDRNSGYVRLTIYPLITHDARIGS
jgi:hypothetical protein